MRIRDNRYDADVPTRRRRRSRAATGPRRRMRASARANTAKQVKFTLPGPMTIVDTLADEHYGEPREAGDGVRRDRSTRRRASSRPPAST